LKSKALFIRHAAAPAFISATQMDTQLNWQRRVSGRFINRDEQDRQDGISAAEYQIAAKKILMFFYPVHPC
jgi:hypothetical protein